MSLREFRLFGALREYGGRDARLFFEVPEGLTVAELRKLVANELGRAQGDRARNLVLDSAVADDRRVLSDSDPVPAGRELCLLPPVCGG